MDAKTCGCFIFRPSVFFFRMPTIVFFITLLFVVVNVLAHFVICLFSLRKRPRASLLFFVFFCTARTCIIRCMLCHGVFPTLSPCGFSLYCFFCNHVEIILFQIANWCVLVHVVCLRRYIILSNTASCRNVIHESTSGLQPPLLCRRRSTRALSHVSGSIHLTAMLRNWPTRARQRRVICRWLSLSGGGVRKLL